MSGNKFNNSKIPLLRKGVNILLDAQWGSTGKGKLGAWLGDKYKYNISYVCSSFSPNAGHTTVIDGREIILKICPSSAITTNCPILVLPTSVIKLDQLEKEREIFGDRILIHPNVAVCTKEDKQNAEITGKHIAGTMQGTGHAIARKLLRIKGIKLAGDYLPKNMIADTSNIIQVAAMNDMTILMEMSQGFDLSLNHGWKYPYLTSRDITVGEAINSCGISHKYVGNVIGSMRAHPIRVGNIEGGYSGDYYPDQHELTWEEVTESAKANINLIEKTTVTKRIRRIFSFSISQLRRFIFHNSPDWMFLNFAQYIDWDAHKVIEYKDLPAKVINFVEHFESMLHVPVRLIGTGADHKDIVEV